MISAISTVSGFVVAPLSFMRTGSFGAALRLLALPALALIKFQILTFGEQTQQRELPKPLSDRFGWGAAPTRAGWHVAPYITAPGDLGAGADLDVADNADLAAKSNKIAKFRTA